MIIFKDSIIPAKLTGSPPEISCLFHAPPVEHIAVRTSATTKVTMEDYAKTIYFAADIKYDPYHTFRKRQASMIFSCPGKSLTLPQGKCFRHLETRNRLSFNSRCFNIICCLQLPDACLFISSVVLSTL